MDELRDSERTVDMIFEWLNQFEDELMEDQPIDESPIELTNVADINLETMIEDCLLEIFSVKSLDLMDLCSLAEACTRFRQITQRIVPKEIRVEKNFRRRYDVDFGTSSRRTRNEIERVFKIFGSSLSAVEIAGDYNTPTHKENFLLNLVTRHCDEDNVKSLAIQWMQISEVFTVKLEPFFKRLQQLDLTGVCISGKTTLFAGLHSLVELRVHYVEKCGAVLENIFPKLERFDYETKRFEAADARSSLTFESLSSFISRHKNLKRLRLVFRCDDICQIIMLQVIGDSCKQLTELHLRIGGTAVASLQPLQTLNSLKTLNLSGVCFHDFKLFSTMVELRELSLFGCDLPKDSDQFTCLDQLKELKICRYKYVNSIFVLDMAAIISRLTNLEKLFISGPRDILDENVFSKIVRIVNGRRNILTLVCKRNFKVKNGEADQKISLIRPYD